MMQEYCKTKEQYKDCILFYRLGDFYEMFFDDALLVTRELEITLTGKDCGLEERAPMCGVPYHAAETYINRLIERGHKVAICEQVEDPKKAKGLVKREVVRIVTPGTTLDAAALDETKNNYLCLLCLWKNISDALLQTLQQVTVSLQRWTNLRNFLMRSINLFLQRLSVMILFICLI